MGLLFVFIIAFNIKPKEKLWIEETYYESNNSAIFTTDLMFDKMENNINPYNSYWAMKIYENEDSKLDKEVENFFESYINNMDKNYIDNLDNLYSIFYISAIDKYINNDKLVNKEAYINSLLKNYDVNSGLFFFNSLDDTKELKFAASNIALKTLINTKGAELNVIEELKRVNIELFNNDEYFTYEDAEYNLINNGLLIFENIILLSKITDIDIKELYEQRVEWFDFWYNWIIKHENNTDIDLLYINSIIKYKLIFDNLNIKKDLILNTNNLYKESYIKQIAQLDMQLAYQLQTINIVAEKNTNIKEFINSEKFYWIYKTQPKSLLEDIYYGTYIADFYDFKYNKVKVKNYFIEFINKIEKFKIKDIYYLEELYKYFNLDNRDLNGIKQEVLSLYVDEFVDKSNIDTDYLVRDIYFACELSYDDSNLNKIYSKLKDEIKVEYLNDRILESDKLQDVYYIYNIARLLNIDLDNKVFEAKIAQLYNNLKTKDIRSIYFILYIYNASQLNLSKNFINNILEDFNELEGKNSEYFSIKPNSENYNENYKTNLNFEGNYFAIKIKEIIKNIR